MGCSTAGEIFDTQLTSERFVLQIMKFEKTILRLVHSKISSSIESQKVGEQIAHKLNVEKLKSIFVLSDGLTVNGSQLTKGISSVLSEDVVVTGGLAGDNERFEKTWVLVDNQPLEEHIVAIGFYGEDFYVSSASKGGWESLGLKRKVTKSKDNILYELDGQPALKLYKHYLGERAEGLPSTGLLFPLGLYEKGEIKVRTILAVDEEYQSITFAGDIPSGSTVTLMKASLSSLVEGASQAAKEMHCNTQMSSTLCCIAISCVGRRLVLGQRVEEEIEAVMNELPPKTMQIGYYSYGEISPAIADACDLYNQTMTLTLIGEY